MRNFRVQCLILSGHLLIASIAQANVTIGEPTNNGQGQLQWPINAPNGQYFGYTERHTGGRDESRHTKVKHDANGNYYLYTDKQTTLVDPVKATEPQSLPRSGADFSPGGFSTMFYHATDQGATLAPTVIDSGFFDMGPGAGGADSLLGATLEVLPLSDYTGRQGGNSPHFGAAFGTPGGSRLVLRAGVMTVLTADFVTLENDPGDTDFSAVLTNLTIGNVVGSQWLAGIAAAVFAGRTLTLDVLPNSRLAEATAGPSNFGPASYVQDGSVTARVGISVRAPEPSSLLMMLTTTLLSRIRRVRP